jgi:ectoine hydroxylase
MARAEPRRAAGPVDLYPSRTGGGPGLRERLDPVLHAAEGSRAPGPLSPSELARFEREGYLFLEGFLGAEALAELTHGLGRLRAEARRRPAPEVVREPGGDEVRSLFAVHRTHPSFARLARHPPLLGMVRQILASAVYVHQSRANLKPGFDGKEFYWHSDFETWHVEDGMPRMRAVSASISLTPTHPHNGPLMVVPGSHREYLVCPGETPKDHHLVSLRRQEYGVPTREQLARLVERGGIAAPTAPAGSLLLFECNLVHGSNGNITPHPRNNVFLVYNSVENALVEPFSGQAPRPEHIASRDFTPLEAE